MANKTALLLILSTVLVASLVYSSAYYKPGSPEEAAHLRNEKIISFVLPFLFFIPVKLIAAVFSFPSGKNKERLIGSLLFTSLISISSTEVFLNSVSIPDLAGVLLAFVLFVLIDCLFLWLLNKKTLAFSDSLRLCLIINIVSGVIGGFPLLIFTGVM